MLQCSVSVSQGAQGTVHVSPAVLALPQSPAVPASIPAVPDSIPAVPVVYSTGPSMDTVSTSSAQVVTANLVSKLISQLLSYSGTYNSADATTIGTTGVAHNQVSVAPCNNTGLFWVMIVSGNISRCQGCSEKILRGVDGKSLPPPDDNIRNK